MSDIQDTPQELPSERGAGIEALKQRRLSTSPPPPPAPRPATDSREEAQGSGAVEVEQGDTASASSSARKKPKKSRASKAPADDDGLIGQPKGQLRQISTRLPVEIRDALDGAIDADPDLSLGELGMRAVRNHHQSLRTRFELAETNDGFAPARKKIRRSRRGGAKVLTPMSITPEEARALQDLSAATSLSVNLVLEMCLRMEHGLVEQGEDRTKAQRSGKVS